MKRVARGAGMSRSRAHFTPAELLGAVVVIVNGNTARKQVDLDGFYHPIAAYWALAAERSVRLSALIASGS